MSNAEITGAEELSEAEAWAEHLLPLPRKLDVEGVWQGTPRNLGIVAARESSPMVSDAVKMLRADRHAAAGNSTGKEFVIHI